MWPQQCPVSAPALWSVDEENHSPWLGSQAAAASSHQPLFQGHRSNPDAGDTETPPQPAAQAGLAPTTTPKALSPPCLGPGLSLPKCIRTWSGGVGSAGSRLGPAVLPASFTNWPWAKPHAAPEPRAPCGVGVAQSPAPLVLHKGRDGV